MNNPYYLKDTQGDYYNKYPEFQAWEEGRQAGIVQGKMDYLLEQSQIILEAKQAGIKEVVEWVNFRKHSPQGFTSNPGYTVYLGFEWQRKLKEWGCQT